MSPPRRGCGGARWGLWLSVAIAGAIAGATAAVLGAFWVHVGGGGAYAPRPMAALPLRLAVWAIITAVALRAPLGGPAVAGRFPP